MFFQKFSSAFSWLTSSLLTSTWLCFWSSFGRCGTNSTTMHGQIFSENLMTHGFWNSNFLCYFTNSQMTIGMKHFPNFLDVFFIFRCWRPSWMFSALNWSLTVFKMYIPLMNFVLSWLCPQTFVLTFWKSPKLFSQILKQNFTQTCCSFLIPEKFAEQAR